MQRQPISHRTPTHACQSFSFITAVNMIKLDLGQRRIQFYEIGFNHEAFCCWHAIMIESSVVVLSQGRGQRVVLASPGEGKVTPWNINLLEKLCLSHIPNPCMGSLQVPLICTKGCCIFGAEWTFGRHGCLLN